jgi:hypothetical protein
LVGPSRPIGGFRCKMEGGPLSSKALGKSTPEPSSYVGRQSD